MPPTDEFEQVQSQYANLSVSSSVTDPGSTYATSDVREDANETGEAAK